MDYELTPDQRKVLTDYLDNGHWLSGNKNNGNHRKTYFDFYTMYVRNIGNRNEIKPELIKVTIKDRCIKTRDGPEIIKKIILTDPSGKEINWKTGSDKMWKKRKRGFVSPETPIRVI